MKKFLTGLCVTTMLLSITTTTAFAAGHGRNYVDTNKDGICDRAYSICYFVDEDNDGICDYRTTKTGKNCPKRFFVDADNDGICDNYSSRTPLRNGTGHRWGCHRAQKR